jgi:hypothetical protein
MGAACTGNLTALGCTVGYHGPLCSQCDEGLGHSGTFDCVKCPSDDQNFGLLIVGILIIVVICGFMVRSSISSATAVRDDAESCCLDLAWCCLQAKASHSIIIKILFSGVQFNGYARNFDFRWPDAVDSLLAAQQRTANVGTAVFNSERYFLLHVCAGD